MVYKNFDKKSALLADKSDSGGAVEIKPTKNFQKNSSNQLLENLKNVKYNIKIIF